MLGPPHPERPGMRPSWCLAHTQGLTKAEMKANARRLASENDPVAGVARNAASTPNLLVHHENAPLPPPEVSPRQKVMASHLRYLKHLETAKAHGVTGGTAQHRARRTLSFCTSFDRQLGFKPRFKPVKAPPVRPATAAELGVAAGGPISMPAGASTRPTRRSAANLPSSFTKCRSRRRQRRSTSSRSTERVVIGLLCLSCVGVFCRVFCGRGWFGNTSSVNVSNKKSTHSTKPHSLLTASHLPRSQSPYTSPPNLCT